MPVILIEKAARQFAFYCKVMMRVTEKQNEIAANWLLCKIAYYGKLLHLFWI